MFYQPINLNSAPCFTRCISHIFFWNGISRIFSLPLGIFCSDDRGVLDESDRFMMSPVDFAYNMATNWSLPSHIVLFDSQEKQLREFLTSHLFKEVSFKYIMMLFLTTTLWKCNSRSCYFDACIFFNEPCYFVTGKEILPCALQSGSRSSVVCSCLCFDKQMMQ